MTKRIAILGVGGRGSQAYGNYLIEHPERARVTAIADADPDRLASFGSRAGVPAAGRYPSWEDLVADAGPGDFDAVVIALPDHLHVDPVLACVAKGWPLLLEKPIAPSETELERLRAGLAGQDASITVCHVLRRTPFWTTVKEVLHAGLLGDLATIQLEENIGFWHFAHSYVRGNWRNEATSSPMSLAKTCHDFDLIRWLVGEAPDEVSSVGDLLHFRAEQAPEGAPRRCTDGCPVAQECPFYAPRYYVDALADQHGWPVALLGADTSRRGRLEALATGPYGRCVYHCDNDVADHQQTLLRFPSGVTATLTTSAFTGMNTRTVRFTGSRGMLTGRMDSGELRLDLFTPTPELPEIPGMPSAPTGSDGPLQHPVLEWSATPPSDGTDYASHGGGDAGLMKAFLDGLDDRHGGRGEDATTLEASLDSHLMAFAAERSRHQHRIVELAEVL